jgi:hypothetical protein
MNATDRNRGVRQLLAAARQAAVPAPRLRQLVAAVARGGRGAVAVNARRGAAGVADPAAEIAERRAAALGAAYAGAMAPFRQALLASNSAEEAMERVQALYADWQPERVVRLVEEALQISAAAGVSAAKG